MVKECDAEKHVWIKCMSLRDGIAALLSLSNSNMIFIADVPTEFNLLQL